MKSEKALSFLTIMIIISVFILLLRFAAGQIIKFNIEQNEANTQASLKIISTSLEAYAKDNHDTYPKEETRLITANPPYLDKEYCGKTYHGYTYDCTLTTSSYTLTARPADCTITGTKSFTLTTGGMLSADSTCTTAAR